MLSDFFDKTVYGLSNQPFDILSCNKWPSDIQYISYVDLVGEGYRITNMDGRYL